MTRAWDMENMWVPKRTRTHGLPSTWRALYPLSYENSWRGRSFNWVHMWQAPCILLGSPLSNSSWVVISGFWWWILSSVMKCKKMNYSTWHERGIFYLSIFSFQELNYELNSKENHYSCIAAVAAFFVPDCPFGFQLDNKSIGCLFIPDNIDWPQVQ